MEEEASMCGGHTHTDTHTHTHTHTPMHAHLLHASQPTLLEVVLVGL